MSSKLLLWLWSRVKTYPRQFQRAQTIYDSYTAKIRLGLLWPSDEQIKAACNDSALHEAQKRYLEVLESCRIEKDYYNLAAVHYQLGLLERLWGNIDQAIESFEKALAQFEKIVSKHPNARSGISLCHFYIGQAFLKKGKNQKAKEQLEMAFDLDQAMNIPYRLEATKLLLKQCI